MTHEGTELQRRFESIKKHAEKTHTTMLAYAKEGQPIPHSSPKLGDGFEIRGSISSYIRKASREATGHDCDNDRVTQVRNYLRYTHNVVGIRQTEDKFVWLIFIRGEWNEYDAVLPLVFGLVTTERANKNWYERKVTPAEAGETRPVAPVKTEYQCRECGDRFPSSAALGGHTVKLHRGQENPVTGKRGERMTEEQHKVLRAIADNGGVIEDKEGGVSPLLADQIGLSRDTVSGVLKRLDDKGFITRDKGRAGDRSKRTYSVHLTMAGLQVEGVTKPKSEEKPETLEEPKTLEEIAKIPLSEPVPKKPRTTVEIEDEDLLHALGNRLAERQQEIDHLQDALLKERAVKSNQEAQDKIDLVALLVKDFEDGKCSALKTISDIAEAVRL
jgi:DNA-binding MarR family transcriptional regulator